MEISIGSFSFFIQAVEEAVNQRYVSSGSLRTLRGDFNQESSQIKIVFEIPDPSWQPEVMCDSWDPASRTFFLVSSDN